MLAKQNLKSENNFPKNFSEEKNITQSVTLSPSEMKYYVAEIAEMLENGKIIDIPKAIHNAKYFAELNDRITAGHWTEHELIEDN